MVTTLAAVVGLLAVAAYLAGTLVQARGLLNHTDISSRPLVALGTAGAILHGIANYLVIVSGGTINLGIYTSASLVSWIMILFVLLASLRLPVLNLLILVLPIGVLGTISLLFTPPGAELHMASLGEPLIWHIAISFIAYSVLFMAACHSVVVGVLERRLKSRHNVRLVRLLPPLETMETLLFHMIWAGVIALTLSIATGFLFLENMFEQRVVHHTALTLASWLLYVVLLVGHRAFGWRGSMAVRWTLIAFVVLVLGYFGSKFVIEVLLES